MNRRRKKPVFTDPASTWGRKAAPSPLGAEVLQLEFSNESEDDGCNQTGSRSSNRATRESQWLEENTLLGQRTSLLSTIRQLLIKPRIPQLNTPVSSLLQVCPSLSFNCGIRVKLNLDRQSTRDPLQRYR